MCLSRRLNSYFFFFNDTATTEIYTLTHSFPTRRSSDLMLGHVRQRLPGAKWHAAGVSLGGNALLKHLGETGETTGLAAAAGVSVPMNLDRKSTRLNSSH